MSSFMCLTILETLDFFDNLGKWREKSGLSFGTFWESVILFVLRCFSPKLTGLIFFMLTAYIF